MPLFCALAAPGDKGRGAEGYQWSGALATAMSRVSLEGVLMRTSVSTAGESQEASMTEKVEQIVTLTAEITSAYVGNNSMPTEGLPALIERIHQSLKELTQDGGGGTNGSATQNRPSVDPHNSVFPDHLVCLDCGRNVSLLTLHLLKAHGLTPEDYRKKWDLPPRYPMAAPKYASLRAKLAKQSGLGHRRR